MDLKLSDQLTTKNTTRLCAQQRQDNSIRTGTYELPKGQGEQSELPPESRGCTCLEGWLSIRYLEREREKKKILFSIEMQYTQDKF